MLGVHTSEIFNRIILQLSKDIFYFYKKTFLDIFDFNLPKNPIRFFNKCPTHPPSNFCDFTFILILNLLMISKLALNV